MFLVIDLSRLADCSRVYGGWGTRRRLACTVRGGWDEVDSAEARNTAVVEMDCTRSLEVTGFMGRVGVYGWLVVFGVLLRVYRSGPEDDKYYCKYLNMMFPFCMGCNDPYLHLTG